MNADKLRERIENTQAEVAAIERKIPLLQKTKEEKLLNGEDVSTLSAEIRDLNQRHDDLTTILPKLQEKLNTKELETRTAEIKKEATRCKQSFEEHKRKIEELRKAVKEEFVRYKNIKQRLLNLRRQADNLREQGVVPPDINFSPIPYEINIHYFTENKDIFTTRPYY